VGLVAEKLKSVSSEGVRLDFDSFSEPEKQLFRKVWEFQEKYGSSPPADALMANVEFINKACEIVYLRVVELFMLVLRMLVANGEVEEWYLKLHLYNFLEDLSECIDNVRKWSEQDREEFLRDMKENGWENKVYRIPRGPSRLGSADDEENEQEENDERT
jgi:hypothetical protein